MSDYEERMPRGLRRLRLTAAFVLGLAVGAGAFAVWGAAADPTVEAQSAEVEASSVSSHTSGREVVGAWSETHFGWVFVYDDGRVLSYTDGLHPVSRDGEPMTGVIEQRLTPYGLELVIAGVLHPRSLLMTPLDDETGIWSEASPTVHSPTTFVMCRVEGTDRHGALKSIDDIAPQLPEFLQDLVSGPPDRYAHATGERDAFVGRRGYGIPCYGFTTDGAESVWNGTHSRSGDVDSADRMSPNGNSFARLTLTDGSEAEFVFLPVLPHDGWVYWDG